MLLQQAFRSHDVIKSHPLIGSILKIRKFSVFFVSEKADLQAQPLF